MKAKLLGFIKTNEHKPANTDEWQDHDEGYINYELFFESEDGKFISIDVNYNYGSCGSGYTSASWGNITRSKVISSLPEGIIIAKDGIFVLISNDYRIFVSEKPSDEWGDALLREIVSLDGVQIAYETGDGGCQYYSSGNADINIELFN